MMVGGTHLKQLFANIFQTEMEAFELKVKACMQEKDKTVQTLQLEAEARETKFEELGKKARNGNSTVEENLSGFYKKGYSYRHP